jgi:hypothetical protein
MSQALSHLHGRGLVSVRRNDEAEEWIFLFTSGVSLQVSGAWRLVAGGHVAVGWRDNGQWFGLSAPFDTTTRIHELVGSSLVDATEVSDLGDLVVRFAAGPSLELFNDSSGHEGWQLYGPGRKYVVAQGGGNVVEFAT